jgi:hypothetical protein
VPGSVNTGGGGSNYLGVGGPGVAYIVYPSAFADLSNTVGNVTYTATNGYKIYKFNSSGSFTI